MKKVKKARPLRPVIALDCQYSAWAIEEKEICDDVQIRQFLANPKEPLVLPFVSGAVAPGIIGGDQLVVTRLSPSSLIH